MKIMRYFFYMVLILSNIEVQGGSFSIDYMLEYLQETGYWNLIQAIKNEFGDDIAIDVCKELVESFDCETIVRVYMIKGGGGSGDNSFNAPSYIDKEKIDEILKYFEKYCNLSEEEKKLIILILRFYSTLIQKMKLEEIINFIKNIIIAVRKHLKVVEEEAKSK